MCTPTEKGYRMEDGTELTNANIIQGNISKKHLDELYKTPMNTIDGVHIRKNLHGLRNDIQSIINIVHNPEYLNPIIDTRIKENAKATLFFTAKVFTASAVIAGGLYKLYVVLFY